MARRNDQLDALITEAGYSAAGLAYRVNRLGAAEGLALNYDYTAVYRWIVKGQVPRGPVPRLIAAALTERLGRRVVTADFGMPDEESVAERSLCYPGDAQITVETIVELGRADMKRRNVITAAPYVIGALAVPSRDWLVAALGEMEGDREPRRAGMSQVDGIREMFRMFQELDVTRGGGHARMALVQYLDDYVLPLLRGRHPEPVRRALFEATAEQCYLIGWMAHDDGRHGLAQRYLIQALRLAQESGGTALGAHILAGMSDQANLLGHPREALMLAKTGQHALKGNGSPACLSRLQVLEARAHAALGDAAAAARAVARAERTFGKVVRAYEPEWARFIDQAYVSGEAAQSFA